MADSITKIRTNYFSVTDETKFREIIASCTASDDINIFEEVKNGCKKFGFGCHGSIDGVPDGDDVGVFDDAEYDLNALFSALQGVICEGDAILYTEVGYEDLRYLTGNCVIITSTEVRCVDIWDESLKQAREMLGNKDFDTKYGY